MSQNADVPEWVTLTEGEEVRWDGHPSLRLVLPSIVIGLVIAIAGIVLTAVVLTEPPVRWLPLVGVPIGLVIVAWAYVSQRSTHYIITSEEVYRKTGIVNRNVAQVRLDRVQNTTYDQSVLERLFSYGHITIYTAGSDTMDVSFNGVSDPQQVNQSLTEALDDIATGERDGL
ncbi:MULTISPECIES: PH domain-containing protein [Halococcus]|uniref:Membrane-flanked domain-containing protein n=1 Tax=Halococcus salifodinae DSM 8989 TaxID=1227456 RepID=M0MTT5_9EURY|nr:MULTISPECIES: PH domain-containing protein [Halococcus]EMA49142.1 membrane-flanked domain-containing protein [Halococcus salifodinae DSM 8989]